MENLIYLFSAYSIVWGVLFVFLILLYKRQEKLKNALEGLQKDNS